MSKPVAVPSSSWLTDRFESRIRVTHWSSLSVCRRRSTERQGAGVAPEGEEVLREREGTINNLTMERGVLKGRDAAHSVHVFVEVRDPFI